MNEGPDYVWQTPVKMELNAEDVCIVKTIQIHFVLECHLIFVMNKHL